MLAALLLQVAAAAQATSPPSPLSPGDELATFRVPSGFAVELVASEPDVGKIVDIAFDDAGRMWAVTAREYPLDGNENDAAAALYETGGADEVLVFDAPWGPGPHVPRVFADGLAMPMAVLPWRDGALVGHGPEILFLRDTDGDGRADAREVVLSGFGIQDSHLMPHRFLRGPGGWVWMAQGAFNESRVVTRDGRVVPFDQCKVGRFRLSSSGFQPGGSDFQVVGHGLNNIWGFVLDRGGETFAQEANDQGYPVVPFFRHASYPGIGDHRHRPYSPWQPALAAFRMGGTGLSGLALSQDRGGFPAPWDAAFVVANPIVNAVQAVAVDRADDPYRLERLPEFMTSSDTWFRPVAAHFGPDGCLYVVDWYNEIISHNEVPRTDPRRDKQRSRVWRVRHDSQERRAPTDMTRVPSGELVAHLDADRTWESRAAWHQIADRGAVHLGDELRALTTDRDARPEARLLASWSLEELGLLDGRVAFALAASGVPALRREAARAVGSLAASGALTPAEGLAVLRAVAPPHRAVERIALADALKDLFEASGDPAVLAELLARVPAPSPEREFERSLLRAALEARPYAAAAALGSHSFERAPDEGVALACLAQRATLGAEAACALATRLAALARAPGAEELALLAEHASERSVGAALVELLRDPQRAEAALRGLLDAGERVDPAAASALFGPALRELARSERTESARLVIEAARAWRVLDLAPAVRALAAAAGTPGELRVEALRAAVELGVQDPDVCAALARSALPGEEQQRLAAIGLAASAGASAPELLFELLPALPPVVARASIRELSSRRPGAEALLAGIAARDVEPDQLEPEVADRLRALFPGDARLEALAAGEEARHTTVLRLAGGAADWVDARVDLVGAFTVEAWVALDEPLTNADGILAAPGVADLNFHDARARLWVAGDSGGGRGDVIIARRRIEPGAWTHVALTRDGAGNLALYLDGELDTHGAAPCELPLEGLGIGRTIPSGAGTAGRLAEVRVWIIARNAAEIGRDARRRLESGERPIGLARAFTAPADFAPLGGNARVETTPDGPPWLDGERLREEELALARVRRLAEAGGDAARGREQFARHCLTCHTVAGEGAALGPALDGSALRGIEGLARAIVTPSAAVESGYRTLLVETLDGERLDGFLASRDEQRIVLRRQSRADVILPRSEIASARFDRLSVMPEGLLAPLSDDEVADLFAYLLSLE